LIAAKEILLGLTKNIKDARKGLVFSPLETFFTPIESFFTPIEDFFTK